MIKTLSTRISVFEYKIVIRTLETVNKDTTIESDKMTSCMRFIYRDGHGYVCKISAIKDIMEHYKNREL